MMKLNKLKTKDSFVKGIEHWRFIFEFESVAISCN